MMTTMLPTLPRPKLRIVGPAEELPPLPPEEEELPPLPPDEEELPPLPEGEEPPTPRPQLHIVSTKLNPTHFIMSPKIALDPQEITGKMIGIVGQNNSGKSGTARRLMEEHIRLGLDKWPFTVCDIENEYATLKELGSILIAGVSVAYGSIKLDITLSNSGEFYELGRRAYTESLTIVLLLDGVSDTDRKQYLNSYITGLYESANDPKKAHSYRIFLEECQEYIPQFGRDAKDELRATIVRFAKRGRKRKLALTLMSQRPANVDKDVLTQAHILFLHFVTYPTDVDLYQDKKGFAIPDVSEKVKQMKSGDVIFLFGKQHIEDHINKPKTNSPWDESGHFDVSLFQQVEGVEIIQEEVVREGAKDDQGTSVVPTAYIHGLERQVPALQSQIEALSEQLSGLQTEIEALCNRPVLGDVNSEELLTKNIQLEARIRFLEKQAAPVRAILKLLKSEGES